jgi:hypothetical protein
MPVVRPSKPLNLNNSVSRPSRFCDERAGCGAIGPHGLTPHLPLPEASTPPEPFTPKSCQAFSLWKSPQTHDSIREKTCVLSVRTCHTKYREVQKREREPQGSLSVCGNVLPGARECTGPAAVRALTLPLFDNPSAPTPPAKRRAQPKCLVPDPAPSEAEGFPCSLGPLFPVSPVRIPYVSIFNMSL